MVKSLIGWASWESNFLFPKLCACHVWSAALGHHCCPSLPLMRADELVLCDRIWTGLPPLPLPPIFLLYQWQLYGKGKRNSKKKKNWGNDDHFLKCTLNVLLSLKLTGSFNCGGGERTVTKIRGIIWICLIWVVLSMVFPFRASCSIRLNEPN